MKSINDQINTVNKKYSQRSVLLVIALFINGITTSCLLYLFTTNDDVISFVFPFLNKNEVGYAIFILFVGLTLLSLYIIKIMFKKSRVDRGRYS